MYAKGNECIAGGLDRHSWTPKARNPVAKIKQAKSSSAIVRYDRNNFKVGPQPLLHSIFANYSAAEPNSMGIELLSTDGALATAAASVAVAPLPPEP